MEMDPSFAGSASLDLDTSDLLTTSGADLMREFKMEPGLSPPSTSSAPGATSSGQGSRQQQLHSEEDVFRSMKIKDTSTTPYSDATQVSPTTPAFNLFPLQNSKLGRSHYEIRWVSLFVILVEGLNRNA